MNERQEIIEKLIELNKEFYRKLDMSLESTDDSLLSINHEIERLQDKYDLTDKELDYIDSQC